MDSYRFRVKEGDYVRLPGGDTGIVSMIEHLPSIVCASFGRPTALPDLVQIVSVRPDKKRRWLGLRKTIPSRFAEEDIDRLELIATREELDALGSES